ncbi:MAG: hypothetical protein ABID67_01785 [Candidatus Nealsonbacteria bacterium]
MISKKGKIKKENNFQSLFFLTIVGIVFVGAMAFLIISNVRITQKRTELKSQINTLQQEILLLEDLKIRYKEGLVKAEEVAYWEERLREQGYKKPGEEAIVVLPSDESEGEKIDENKSFLDKVKGFFGF